MRLQPRIVLSTMVLVTIIVGLTGGLFLYLLRNTLYTQIGENALDVARRRHAVQVLLVLVVGFAIAIPGAMLLAGGIMRLFDFPPAPLLLSLVLGDLMEQAMRPFRTQSATVASRLPRYLAPASSGSDTPFFVPVALAP
jgi:TctA family transporter